MAYKKGENQLTCVDVIFQRKFGNDNHVIKLGSRKRFVLVYVHRRLERNTKVGVKPTASSAEMPTICETFFYRLSIFFRNEMLQFREKSETPFWGVTSPCFWWSHVLAHLYTLY